MEGVIWPPAGRYIVAVSGGADSMTLLDLLVQAAGERDYELVVAHFDHGVRPDSAADAAFVDKYARRYGLPYATTAAGLGDTGEAQLRDARYTWLESVRVRHEAAAILTAHHQDDRLETSLLNLARGTGRTGLAPMPPATGLILRPLINVPRVALRAYALSIFLKWREDPTNQDVTNPRNFLRHRLLPAAPDGWREKYLGLMDQLAELNAVIDQVLASRLAAARRDNHTFAFKRAAFRELSEPEASELIAAAARALRPGLQLDRPLLLQAARLALTGDTGKQRPLRRDVVLMLMQSQILITTKTD